MKLLDEVRQKLRAGLYAYRTEQAYLHWIERYIRWHAQLLGCWRHHQEMSTDEVEAYLSHLAGDRCVTSGATKNRRQLPSSSVVGWCLAIGEAAMPMSRSGVACHPSRGGDSPPMQR